MIPMNRPTTPLPQPAEGKPVYLPALVARPPKRRGPVGRTLASVGTVVIAVDQVTKTLPTLVGPQPWLVPLRNPGLSLGLVTTSRWSEIAAMSVGLALLAAALLPAVRRGRVGALPVGLLLGGAFSNLADRATLGSVRDMLPVGQLVVINLADIAVLIGVLWIFTTTTRQYSPRASGKDTASASEGR